MINTLRLSDFNAPFFTTPKMPLLFVGHGNPMNAILDNSYSKAWRELGKSLVKPHAILCISAHWLTNGTAVCMSDKPTTIHDFGGFPEALFQVQYPAVGAPIVANNTIAHVQQTQIAKDFEWGLDHGSWSVLTQMYPLADIPVFQMSIDYNKAPQYHYDLAKELLYLRRKGVMIIASGNIVHNLGMLRFNGESTFDWAIAFDEYVKKAIESNDAMALVNYQKLGQLARMAHPSNDHYLPLLYAMGLRETSDQMHFFNDSFDLGSISMRSVIFS